MQLIQHVTVESGGAASITFSGIPQTFTDLVVVLSGRSTIGLVFNEARLRFNGATTNYSFRALQGTGSSTVSFNNDGTSTSLRAGLVSGANSTSNTFGSLQAYIPNYRSGVAKSVSSEAVSENNATESYQEIIAGLWNDSAAITSISILPHAGSTWVQNSVASLYGITAGSSGGVVVS